MPTGVQSKEQQEDSIAALEQSLIEAMASIDAVESLLAAPREGVAQYFAVIDEPDDDLLNNIFERELAVQDQFGDDVPFCLDVVFCRGRSQAETMPGFSEIWSRRAVQ